MQIRFIGNVEASDQKHGADTDRARHLSSLGFDGARISGLSDTVRLVDLATEFLADTGLSEITLTHRPETSPVETACRLAALDQASGGRLHVFVSAVPLPTQRQGFLHEADQLRTDEYLVLLKRLWLNEKPFDHEGAFYRVRQGVIASRPFNGGTIPLVLDGRSATAIRVAAKHADCYDLGGLDVASARQAIDRMETMAASFGRAGKIDYNLHIEVDPRSLGSDAPGSATVAPEAPATISGTPEQMAISLLGYVDLGVSRFTVHGSVDTDRLQALAETVVPLVRRGVAHRAGRDDEGGNIGIAAGSGSRRAARIWTSSRAGFDF